MATAQRKTKYLTSPIHSMWPFKMKPYLSMSQWLSTFPWGKKNKNIFSNRNKISVKTSEIIRPVASIIQLWILTASNRLQKFTETVLGTIQEQPTYLAGTKVSYFQPLSVKHIVPAESAHHLLLSSSILSTVTAFSLWQIRLICCWASLTHLKRKKTHLS